MQVSWYFDSSYSRWDLGGGVEVYVAGAAFEGGVLLEGESLARRVADLVGECAARGGGFALNGFYGACYADGARVVLAVDHVRSRPLFYAERDGVWHVGNAVWDMARALGLGAGDVEEASRIDFLGCGYVCGDRTLLRGLHQLYADASGWLDRRTGRLTLRDNGVLLAMYDRPLGEEELYDEHTRLLEGAMRRLMAYAGGRTIAVPLSAGLDSKLLVCLLKKYGYGDVVAFTYGRPSNAESVVSRRVAESLGVRWLFVEYTDEQFRQDWREMVGGDFLRYGSYLSSMPHMQDFSAMKHFRAKGLLAPGSVIVPGHTPVGVLQPSDMAADSLYGVEDVVEFLFDKRMECSAWLRRKYGQVYRHNIRETFPYRPEPLSAHDFTQLSAYWFRRHREARYLVNSLRNYHYFGYDSWMPLWEVDYTQFENSVPIGLRLDRVWYRWYVEDVYSQLIGRERLPFVNSYRPRDSWWYQTLKHSRLGRLALRCYQYRELRRQSFCANAIYGRCELFGRIMRGDNVLAKYAEEALGGILGELSR